MLTEIVELPSKGILYPPDSPLSSGKVEIRYMTAKDEDMITNPNYIKQGIDFITRKLVKELLVDKSIDIDSLLIGDRDALLVAIYMTTWDIMYKFKQRSPETGEYEIAEADLSKLEEIPLLIDPLTVGENEFKYEFPYSGTNVTFKLLTWGDISAMRKESDALKKLYPEDSFNTTLEWKQIIKSVEGKRELSHIYKFVDNMIRRDSAAFRHYIDTNTPNINFKTTVTTKTATQEGVEIPFSAVDLFLAPPRE